MEKAFLNPTVKTILIFTIILLTGILIIFAGSSFKKTSELTLVLNSTPTPTPTAVESTQTDKASMVGDPEIKGWKTYSDQVNGYEFKYPDNLDIVDGDIRISTVIEKTDYESLPSKCPVRGFEGFVDEFEGKKIAINNI